MVAYVLCDHNIYIVYSAILYQSCKQKNIIYHRLQIYISFEIVTIA